MEFLIIIVFIIVAVVNRAQKTQKKNVSSQQPPQASRPQTPPQPVNHPQPSASQTTFSETTQPGRAYRPNYKPALHHEEWMTLPKGCQPITCRYCGALNAVPMDRHTKYACYFCREEL